LDSEVENRSVLAALSVAIEARDNEAAGHNERIAHLSVRIGHAMGLDNGKLRVLAHAGLLHDIGKLAIPDALLRTSTPLNDEEIALMQTHPLRGVDILDKLGNFKAETAAIVAHHERIDGSGYPHGLVGEQIPIEARIIAVADTYESIIADRPSCPGRSPEVAFALLHKERGVKLDTDCVNALFKVLAPVERQWPFALKH
jgi:two-component system response regulator RpfG